MMFASLNSMSSIKMKKTLSYQGNNLNYTITYKEQKHIILRVVQGEVRISAPLNTADWEVEKIIYKNISKIVSVQNQHIIASVYDLNTLKPWVKIFDEEIEIIIDETLTRSKIENNKIYMKNYFNHEEQIKKLYSILAKHYKNWFISRTIDWSLKMNVQFRNVNVKLMKAKWGYCLPKELKIAYNTKLLHFNDEIISYVIIHELTHILHPNHSKEFWHFVERYCPNYKELQTQLNSTGI
ncbi:metal-dependent hydrolase [Mesoplasma entomophilum]|uniref:Metal-dependent hydrolase n=3 Tax=Mesoplasma entomophilum TaxID=2149 RepID=A0A3S5Y0P9_9MOLU|nr:metal-dependent hydrolase [Mesoplasma entomophilum]AVN60684.1 metal-dependent hydrolase [Mesoplasma entomophilum]